MTNAYQFLSLQNIILIKNTLNNFDDQSESEAGAPASLKYPGCSV